MGVRALGKMSSVQGLVDSHQLEYNHMVGTLTLSPCIEP